MGRYRMGQAAAMVGVAPITLKRWLLSGRVAEVARDRNGWRVFDDSDILRLKQFASQLQRPVTPGDRSDVSDGPGVSADKLRGGYYTSPSIADWLCNWAVRSARDSVLEPSCGNGVFLNSTSRCLKMLGATSADVRAQVKGVEILQQEAEKAAQIVEGHHPIHCGDFFEWADRNREARFDCVVGNPPFIRYQTFPEPSRSKAMTWMRQLGMKPNKLTNIWVPFVAISAHLLATDGRLAMVLPAELLQVTYAAQLRSFLIDRFRSISILTCNEMLFENAEQEVVLCLAEGRLASPSVTNKCRIDLVESRGVKALLEKKAESLGQGRLKTVKHDSEKWLKYFLTSREITFLRKLRESAIGIGLGEFASVDVGIVTGKNDFFVVSQSQVEAHALDRHVVPLMGRSAQIKGAVVTEADWAELAEEDKRVFLFNVAVDRGHDLSSGARAYVESGERRGVHRGYKCSIRKCWYSVPSVWEPDCFLFRQIYDFPRVAVNRKGATSTDTIHRMKCSVDSSLLASNIYTHLTAASAEVEGRSYGGGVLELEPGEAERVLVPNALSENAIPIDEADAMIRQGRLAELLKENDKRILMSGLGLSQGDCNALERIWTKMRDRRMSRRKQRRG